MMLLALLFVMHMLPSSGENIPGMDTELTEYWRGREYPKGHYNHGIQVPFYLYSGGGFDAFRKGCDPIVFSKGAEVSWLNRLENHPWRQEDPEEGRIRSLHTPRPQRARPRHPNTDYLSLSQPSCSSSPPSSRWRCTRMERIAAVP